MMILEDPKSAYSVTLHYNFTSELTPNTYWAANKAAWFISRNLKDVHLIICYRLFLEMFKIIFLNSLYE